MVGRPDPGKEKNGHDDHSQCLSSMGTYPAISLMTRGNSAMGNCRADKISVVWERRGGEGRAVGMGGVENCDQLPSGSGLRAQYVLWWLVARCVTADDGREHGVVSWSWDENRLLVVEGSVVRSRHRREKGRLKSKGDLLCLLLPFLLTRPDNAVDGTNRGDVVFVTHPVRKQPVAYLPGKDAWIVMLVVFNLGHNLWRGYFRLASSNDAWFNGASFVIPAKSGGVETRAFNVYTRCRDSRTY